MTAIINVATIVLKIKDKKSNNVNDSITTKKK